MIRGGVTCADCSGRACASSPEAKASPRAVGVFQIIWCQLSEMEGRPERLADYFVVVGVGQNLTRFEQFPSEDVDLPQTSADPITDIAVVFSRYESPPKGYSCIETTASGHSANLNAGSLFSSGVFLCYQQGRDKPPITEISVFYANQNRSTPSGHETLAFSVGGRPADLNQGGTPTFLTFKKGVLYGHNTAITGLGIIIPSKGEDPPPGYKLLHLDLNKGLMGPSLFLCFRTSIVHPPAISYTPELISRYPMKDYPEFPLPPSVPLFCLPFGISVEHWDRRAPFPLPTFSTFALTNAKGQCMYGAAVVFYEQVTEHSGLPEMRKALNVSEKDVLHMNKCICLLSHWPFFSSFKSFLSALYRLSISSNLHLPIERYISNLMLDVPFPTMERPRVLMVIGTVHIVFSLPVQTPLPLSVSTHWSLLCSLDADNCLTLLSLLLLEQKVVLHSSRRALLTCVGEALRSILFPFSWQCTYIPMCPLAFSSYLQAPVPFIIGIDSQYFDVFEKPVDVCVVDLDANLITLSKEAKHLLKNRPLPSKPQKTLKQALNVLSAKVAGLDPGFDFAVQVAPMEYKETNLETVDVEIREAFLHFNATILRQYRMCLKPLLSAPSERSRDTSHLFDHQLFLKHCPAAEWPFFSYFFDTQIFNGFIEQRSFAHAHSTALAFFDECTEKVVSNPSAKLLDVGADVTRRSDLPTVVAVPPNNSKLPKGKTYSYQVFPQLDPHLFDSQSHLMVRSPSTWSILPGSPMVARRTLAEKNKDKQTLERAQRNDELWSKCLLSHICSLWYVLLPSHLSTHWNKMGVLSQALNLLEDMRKKQALPSDEVCYRVLMEQCVKLGRPALAVRVYHEMIKAGIQPNAVTYGFYNKAVIEGKWPSNKHNWRILKIVIYACFYLLKAHSHNDHSQDAMGEPDFSLITRSGSLSSRKSISALDVGVEDEEKGSGSGGKLYPLKRKVSGGSLHYGKVYKLSTGMVMGGGDYVVRGDSSYMAEKSPRWAEEEGEGEEERLTRGVWQYSTEEQSSTKIRRLSRVVHVRDSEAPQLHVELTSCSQCPSCKSLLYDEVIMANWSSSDADYKTTCPYCQTRLVASLTITTKQTLPYSENKMKQKQQKDVIEEGNEEMDGPLPPNKSSTWDWRQANRVKNADNINHDSQKGVQSHALPTQNSVVGEGRDTPSPTGLDALDGAKLEYPPGLLFTPPRTDPLHRRLGSQREGDDATHSVQKNRGPVESSKDWNDVESPLPDRLLVSHARTSEPDKAKNSGTDSPSQEQPTSIEIMVSEFNRGDSVANPSPSPHSQMCSLPISTVGAIPPCQGQDEPDAGVSSYIARMRARGHRRSSSAPVPYQPPPMLPTVELKTEGEGGSEASQRREKTPCYRTECFRPLVVPYLSPVVLRKEVESFITQEGGRGLEKEELVRDRPIMYWNLVWYFSRLQLPTYLPLLPLWSLTRANQELMKHYVQMKVDLLWDACFPGVRDPLYLVWLGKVPRTVQLPPNPQPTRRDSESQLQSLVARTQCGDFFTVLNSLLEDRRKEGVREEGAGLLSRSVYREILFLKSVLSDGNIDIDLFEREYLQTVQRLPREVSSLLHLDDYCPSPRALQCRREFGCLHIS